MSSLLNSNATSAKFPKIGTRVGGRVTEDAREVQQRDFDSGELLFWDDEKPRMQLVVTVDTGTTDPSDPDDDGERAIYIKGQMLQATRAACKRVKKFAIKEGDYFAVTFAKEEPLPKGKKGNPQKIYEVEFTPATGGSGLLSGDRDDEESTPAPSRKAAPRSSRKADEEPPF
jgi:hypothetical protein